MNNDITILFQGDSVTDCGRGLDEFNGLGDGYVKKVDDLLKERKSDILVVNRGISGNRAIDLKNRWKTDCLDIRPNILFILIGINDVWRRYDSNDPTTCESFVNTYKYLIKKTKEELNIPVILLEPFLLDIESKKHYREDLDPKREAVEKLANEYGCRFIGLDSIFRKKCDTSKPEFWAEDGVHPTDVGHQVIAEEIIKVLTNMGIV